MKANTTHRSHKPKKKKVFIVQQYIICWTLLIATVLAILYGTLVAASYGYRVFSTQVKLISIHYTIESAESERIYHQQIASDPNYPSVRREAEQNQADACAAQGILAAQKRADLHNSSDSVIAWAAKDDVELSVLICGIAIFLAIALIWFLIVRFDILFEILSVEKKITCRILALIFLLLCVITFSCSHVFKAEYQFFNHGASKSKKKPRVPKVVTDDNVVPIYNKGTKCRKKNA